MDAWGGERGKAGASTSVSPRERGHLRLQDLVGEIACLAFVEQTISGCFKCGIGGLISRLAH